MAVITFCAHRVADHAIGLDFDGIVRRHVIGRIRQIQSIASTGAKLAMSIRVDALKPRRVKLFVFEQDVVVLSSLVASRLVLVLTGLPVTPSTYRLTTRSPVRRLRV